MSDATAAVLASVPVNTVAPEVTGIRQVGETLTTTDGTWTGFPAPTFTYQWQVSDDGIGGWTDIPSATNSTFVLTGAEVDKYLRAEVTGTNPGGSDSTRSAMTAARFHPPRERDWYVETGGSNTNDCLSVPEACATLQAAVNRANSGDTVIVGDGTFVGGANVVGKNITIKGRGRTNYDHDHRASHAARAV